MRGMIAVCLLTAVGCNDSDSDAVWLRFNHKDDTISVAIVDGEPGPPVTAELTSTTGEAVIGSVEVDPGSGPVGTEHDVVVTILDDFEERVRRVDLRADAGDRGERVFDMERDSADLGIWVQKITSGGIEGEQRVDVLRFLAFEIVEGPLPGDTDIISGP